MQDEKRIEIVQRVFRGELTVLRAAVILGLSERQCYRNQAASPSGGSQGSDPRQSAIEVGLVGARSRRRSFGVAELARREVPRI